MQIDSRSSAPELHEVLSPWAEADAIAPRGITPRLASLEGRTVGIFLNSKRSAPLVANAVAEQLGKLVPGASFSRYSCTAVNVPEMLTAGKEKFESWVRGVDAVVLTTGD
jgi:hypothetical protein